VSTNTPPGTPFWAATIVAPWPVAACPSDSFVLEQEVRISAAAGRDASSARFWIRIFIFCVFFLGCFRFWFSGLNRKRLGQFDTGISRMSPALISGSPLTVLVLSLMV